MAAQKADSNQPKRNPADHLKGHRWKKGQSGNPKGKQPGKTLTELIREELKIELKPGVTKMDALIAGLVNEAIRKKSWAFAEIGDRIDPKPKKLELTGEDGGPIELKADFSALSDAELEALHAASQKLYGEEEAGD